MICTVVGARPNFIKMAPIIQELTKRDIPQLFVHTGQHYDAKMSAIFFEQLQMPEPDVYLGIGGGSHADQTARIMLAFERVCIEHDLKLVIVAGDVNSTLACALVATKLNIPVAHVESGLRSFDRTMPEEINRILCDHISALLFTTEPSGNDNLVHEGIDANKIYFVGNSMIDTLRQHLPTALRLTPWINYQFEEGKYGVVTLHRPANVDSPEPMKEIINALEEISQRIPLIFPMHPRTYAHNKTLLEGKLNLHIVEPLGYLEFLGLMARAQVVITDSGGIQEETTALNIPCVTIRDNTERPVTIIKGTNQLVAVNRFDIVKTVLDSNQSSNAQIPELWDGQAAVRIVDIIERWINNV